jgi:hypothetical protein
MTSKISKNYDHYIKNGLNSSTELNTNLSFNVYVVYFINCLVNKNYYTWIQNQLQYVKHYNAKIYVP